MSYFPPPHPADWATVAPGAAGLDAEAIAAAAQHAYTSETPWKRDLAFMVTSDFQERSPWNETLGPVRHAERRMASCCAAVGSSPNGATRCAPT
jgi:hypothetical protein